MSLLEARFFAGTLGMHVSATVILPDTPADPAGWPCFYLLHGLSDDHTIWLRRTRIEHYALRYKLAIVMPQGFRGFYATNHDGPDYQSYIVNDVIGFAERSFRLHANRSARCIGGLSMGGYGAMRTALSRPDLFVSANSHSGALLYPIEKPDKSPLMMSEHRRIFGPNPAGTDNDLNTLAARLARLTDRPKLLIDCGTQDFLLEQNRAFHATLDALKIEHTYREFPGDHNWDFWDTHIRDALEFHAAALGITPA